MPDSMKGAESFGADHYRPKTLFPKLEVVYSNLFYCCNPCNSRKRDYWPTEENINRKFIPNPCEHEMFRHLRFNLAEVEGRSLAGNFTSELLDLNDPEVVKYRETILHMIELALSKKRDFQKERDAVIYKVERGSLEKVDAEKKLNVIDSALEKLSGTLARLGVSP
jgi:hypothetical protein